MRNELDKVKSQQWFYEFTLPDGTKTESYLPEIARRVHETREKALRSRLEAIDSSYQTSLDISCHEGYFSLILSEYLKIVTGLDKNHDSLYKAKQITTLIGNSRNKLKNNYCESCDYKTREDFVQCFG